MVMAPFGIQCLIASSHTLSYIAYVVETLDHPPPTKVTTSTSSPAWSRVEPNSSLGRIRRFSSTATRLGFTPLASRRAIKVVPSATSTGFPFNCILHVIRQLQTAVSHQPSVISRIPAFPGRAVGERQHDSLHQLLLADS